MAPSKPAIGKIRVTLARKADDLMRKMFATFGIDEMAAANFDQQIAREEAADRRGP